MKPYQFVQCDATKLTQELEVKLNKPVEKSFDVIFSMNAAPYMKDQVKAIHEIWKSLKVGGVAIFGTAQGYFGKLAKELFPAEGSDAVWSKDNKAIIITRSSDEPNLPCLDYKWVPPLPTQLKQDAYYRDRLFLNYSDNKSNWHGVHPFPKSIPSTYQPPGDDRSAEDYAQSYWDKTNEPKPEPEKPTRGARRRAKYTLPPL